MAPSRCVGTTKLRSEQGPVEGTIQYEPRRTLEHFGVGADAVLANVEYRRIGDRAWVLAAESTQVPHLGFPILVRRVHGRRLELQLRYKPALPD